MSRRRVWNWLSSIMLISGLVLPLAGCDDWEDVAEDIEDIFDEWDDDGFSVDVHFGDDHECVWFVCWDD
ncbi:MAG: hypothetical protein HJJLKODD_00355 [Phycisphaerae bacterium]|nr:hypothetical protein [Phycisphaerae bacterium]